VELTNKEKREVSSSEEETAPDSEEETEPDSKKETIASSSGGGAATVSSGAARKISFEAVESEPGQKVVMFIGEPGSEESNKLVEGLNEIAEFGQAFEYVYVECGHEDSKAKCDGAGFKEFPRYFTNSAEGGIESVGTTENPPSKEDMIDHLKFRVESIKEDNTITFESVEQLNKLASERPVVVKFHQLWCGHCKKLKKHFQKAASYSFVKDKAYFVDLDCGKDEGKSFCGSEGVNSYPTLKIWLDGGKTVSKHDGIPRTHKELAKFMEEVADGSVELTNKEKREVSSSGHDEL